MDIKVLVAENGAEAIELAEHAISQSICFSPTW
jgi:hypothetical protein